MIDIMIKICVSLGYGNGITFEKRAKYVEIETCAEAERWRKCNWKLM